MNRPDPGSPDQGANQDDAVWLDLVSRLQAPQTPPHQQEPSAASGISQASGTAEPPQEAVASPPGADNERLPGFADFDPLGLAGSAEREPSAAERAREAGSENFPASGPRDYTTDDSEDEFVPEDPPSLAGTEPLTMLAWLGAVGGPITLLLFAMFWRAAPLLAILGVIAAFVAAVGYLIMRLPHDKTDDDDGARV